MRESPPTRDPRSGWPLFVPPMVMLWIGERPLAVRLRSVVAISRFPTKPRLVSMLEGDASPPAWRWSGCRRRAYGASSRTRRARGWRASGRSSRRSPPPALPPPLNGGIEGWVPRGVGHKSSLCRPSFSAHTPGLSSFTAVVRYGSRTCKWLSCCASGSTRPGGPLRPVFGPTKISAAPAAREAVDQLLCERAVDVGGVPWCDLAPVGARVVDVDVEAVLVAGVADVAELGSEVAAVRAAEVADGTRGACGCVA